VACTEYRVSEFGSEKIIPKGWEKYQESRNPLEFSLKIILDPESFAHEIQFSNSRDLVLV
jgi:hypothetical protein